MSNLNSAAIRSYCAECAQHVEIEVVAETGSTNADLMARSSSLQQPVLRIAERQTAGRGRAGRSWRTEGAQVLTFSLAWRFQDVQSLSGLPLAVGVCVAEVLQTLAIPVQLKWPNDILRDGKKLAGILIESSPAGSEGVWAIIGIGLNLLIPEQLEQEIGRAVADAPWLAQMDRNQLLASLLNGLSRGMQEFAHAGFAAFQTRWNTLHAYAGLAVRVLDQGVVQQQGLALGVDGQGRLLLDAGGTQLAVLAGDVSLRLQE
jgi:BirA family biotin operon repressor/biotin-[acetyl-CoA-carboxylase] ligase